MAATWKEVIYHGAGPTESDWTDNGKYHKADTDPTGDVSATAVVRPTSGTNYSWAKYTKSKWTTTPSGKIMNLRWFTNGADIATGVKLYAKKSASYTEPSASDETGLASMVDASTYTSASPLSINSGDVLTNPSTGTGTQDYLVTQVGVGATANPGSTTGYVLTRRYDES